MGLLALVTTCTTVQAQCAMCRMAVSSASNAAALAKSLNLASLVLLIPPVTIFSAIFIVAFRHRKAPQESALEATEEDESRRE